MSKLEIAIGEKAFSFTDWQDWVNNAQEMFYANELNRHNSICIDASESTPRELISSGRLQNMTEFTSGYLQEVTGDLDGPACTVCGAIMVRNHKMYCSFKGENAPCKCGHKCLSCGETRPS